jgi:putative transposase
LISWPIPVTSVLADTVFSALCFIMHVHVVSVTKYRHPVFTARHLEPMEQIMRDVCADSGAELAEFSGEAEHVHLLVNFPPTVAISRLVNSLKGVSSRRPRQELPGLRRHYWRAKRLWSGSYFAGSVGGPPSPSCASTLSSRNVPPDRLTSGRLHHQPEGRQLVATLAAPPALRSPAWALPATRSRM